MSEDKEKLTDYADGAFGERVKQVYDDIAPSEELIEDVTEKIKQQRKKRRAALIKLCAECVGSAAACLALALGINAAVPGISVAETAEDAAHAEGSIFAVGSVFPAAAALFVILAAIFFGLYFYRKKKSNDELSDKNSK